MNHITQKKNEKNLDVDSKEPDSELENNGMEKIKLCKKCNSRHTGPKPPICPIGPS